MTQTWERFVVTIDGPSGVGKRSLRRGMANTLDMRQLDTGTLYRAVAIMCRNNGVDTADPIATGALVGEAVFELDDGEVAYANGIYIAFDMRSAYADKHSAIVSQHPSVRAALMDFQVNFARGGGILDGRDTGVSVWPAAQLKLFLTADPEERAKRRAADIGTSDVAGVAAELALRDYSDANRATSPTAAAPDAHFIDSTSLSIDEVLALALTMWYERRSA